MYSRVIFFWANELPAEISSWQFKVVILRLQTSPPTPNCPPPVVHLHRELVNLTHITMLARSCVLAARPVGAVARQVVPQTSKVCHELSRTALLAIAVSNGLQN
jgi:hypothetical protein